MFADLILPLALHKLYTFAVPPELAAQVKPGVRVEVQFGKSRHYAAVVRNLHSTKPPAYDPKPILDVLDEQPVVTELHLQFWEWLARYYCCTVGEVMSAALPAGMKLSSETKVSLSPLFDKDDESLGKNERIVADALLVQDELSVDDILKIVQLKSVIPLLKRMIDKRLIYLKEESREKYQARMGTFVKLNEPYKSDPTALRQAFEILDKRAPRQVETLMAFLDLSRATPEVPMKKLCEFAGSTPELVKKIAEKQILVVYKKEISRLGTDELPSISENSTLSEEQSSVLIQTKEIFKEKNVTLLHGVTGSGKTQLYLELIQDAMDAGQQVLYLVPEIALTAQLVGRLQQRFGSNVQGYHSKFNDNERVEIWQAVRDGKPLVMGARSAIFLPFQNLGLIIVDEEHDPSYKQQDPAPRYNARDAAIYLANLSGAKVLLGTATPSLESYHNATHNKYGYVKLDQRYSGIELPEISIVDLRDEYKKRRMKDNFSTTLIEEIKGALDRKEQVILFQNRRGYAPALRCNVCDWHAGCPHCDVTLTYHKFADNLRCHYCGYQQQRVSICPACRSTDIKIQGFGTEKIEDDLKIFFPEASIARMDLDTVRGKHDHDKLIRRFEDKEVDILVGTQMVTKGLDFDNVGIVGVLSADQLLRFPDFRATERAWQLLMQVSGRAGRKQKRGKVVIQAFNTEHPVLAEVIGNLFEDFSKRELAERQEYQYPPYFRLIGIKLRHKDKKTVTEAAAFVARWLRQRLGTRVLGPAEPSVAWVRNLFILDILLKLERNATLLEVARQAIDEALVALSTQKGFTTVRASVDVDVY